MNRKDRVLAALNHNDCTPISYNLDFTEQAHNIMKNHLNDEHFEQKTGRCLNGVQYCGWPTETENKGYYKDAFGVVWNRNGADKDIGVIDSVLIPELENNTYVFPPVDEKRLRKEFQNLILNKQDMFTFAGIGFSMFERSWSLCGMEGVLIGMISEPEALHKLYDQICDYNLKVIDIALEYDIDGFYFGDDWGQQKGLIMGPGLWREFIKPRMKKMYAKVKNAGKYVLQHSCGDIEEIFPDLIEIGLDCYQTFQPEIYDIQKIKETFGGKLTFWGGISTQRLLPFETPEKVKEETQRIIDIMKKSGGYIAAPTHALTHDIPPENIIAMLEVFKAN